tara:strand:+ start:2270 stop:2656 length:387 start_codon:yes stop_codon:yes gene_type:complete
MKKLFSGLCSSVVCLWVASASLYGQSVNLDTIQKIQLMTVEDCAVVQINASWNYQNRVRLEKLVDCYIAEVDLENKKIGAIIQQEWKIKVVPTVIIFKKGVEVKRFEPGLGFNFDEKYILDEIKKAIK